MEKNKKVLLVFLSIIIISIILIIIEYFLPNKITNIKINVINDKVNIDYKVRKKDQIYCAYNTINEVPSEHTEWLLSEGNCEFDLKESNMYFYLKDSSNKITYGGEYIYNNYIDNLKVVNENIYLAVGGTEKINITYDVHGTVNENITYKSENEKIALVTNDGIVSGITDGKTTIKITIMKKEITVNVVVTSLIIPRPNEFNNSRKNMPCGIYTKEDNDLLDKILESRINNAGYQTRAGVVEAARFLTLELPYRIRYFSENGRLSRNGVDGEGRYYHKGLYLHSSRFENITKTMHGPQTWGCTMYSYPSDSYPGNGLDCSGFVSWALYNAGFDVQDVGAGLSEGLDLTDYGERLKIDKDLIKSNKIKVGDLLSGKTSEGGHIAIIVGMDNEHYYVAESLWYSPYFAVVITKHKKEEITDYFYYIMLMDSYYKEDGKLTNLWY